MNRVRTLTAAWALAAVGALAQSPTTPDDLIRAVDQMTPEQANDFVTKLKAKHWEPVPEGFFARLGVRTEITANELDEVRLALPDLSAGDLDLESVGGYDFTLLWRVLTPRFRIGLRMGAQAAEDSDLTPGGYSRADLAIGTGELVANYQLLRAASWLVWIEGGVGGGAVQLETVDTPAGGATTLRDFDGDFRIADARLGVSWRINPILSLSASGGYRFAEEIDLQMGGEDIGRSIDPSGVGVQLGLALNL